jgi:hypothetical protein
VKSILIGNGFDIQFGGKDYINRNIIIRAINNMDKDDFPCDIYPKEIITLLSHLYIIIPSIIAGNYYKFAVMHYEKKSLIEFKKRYNNFRTLSLYDIGIEDYFFIYELFSRENKISNPERFDIRQALKRMFVDAIFNKGEINKLIKKFPYKLRKFLLSYDNIFTTNYDNNIENFIKHQIHYLHGAFHILDEVYNSNSFRNMLPDSLVDKVIVQKNFKHLYSNILMTYAGELKDFSMKTNFQANEAIEKFIQGMEEKPELIPQIEKWKYDDNYIVRNMYDAILIRKNTHAKIAEYYPIDQFQKIKDTIDIIGLYPSNDSHIFNIIRDNISIDIINFYFYETAEISLVENILKEKVVKFHSVKELWGKLGSR